ncbi:hypothetical protein JTE90_023222 [Oedothorax gibbosus]|uniref:Uncharacterized protein n=1 Tax=Oedothorax gibbosus TaxID=931172 RepID=A0AAV6VLV1_9ARAC|nr:hypothetical protein JTE90_023222 [Oedothorax gibbosus]
MAEEPSTTDDDHTPAHSKTHKIRRDHQHTMLLYIITSLNGGGSFSRSYLRSQCGYEKGCLRASCRICGTQLSCEFILSMINFYLVGYGHCRSPRRFYHWNHLEVYTVEGPKLKSDE